MQGVAWDGTRAAQRQVAQRFSRKPQPTRSVQEDADEKREVKRLTSRMKKAPSAKELVKVLDAAMDGLYFDFIHASAAYTQLVALKRRQCLEQTDWKSPALLRLHAQVEDMALQDQLNAQASANVLWSLAQLSERFSVPTQLLAALVKSVPTKVKGMNAQGISNIFWASAKVKDVAPVMLEMVPAIVAQIPKKAKDMDAQGLSNCLWASAQLKDVAPDVLEAVPAIVTQIPGKAQDMIPQHLSNCLFACAQLKDEVLKVVEIVPAIVGEISLKISDMSPQQLSNSLEALVLLHDSVPEVEVFLKDGGSMDDIMRSAAARLNTLLPRIRGKDFSFTVPVVVWACAMAEMYDDELLDSVATRLGSRTKLSALPDFGVCALSWSYQVLDTDDDFEDFKALLMSETKKRGFSEAIVQSCPLGR